MLTPANQIKHKELKYLYYEKESRYHLPNLNIKLNVIFVMFIFLTLLSIAPAGSITIPSDKNIPTVSKGIEEFVMSSPSSQAKEARTNVDVGGSGGGRSVIERTIYLPAQGDPVQIRKSIVPINENGYHVGDIVGIFVEIKNMGQVLNHVEAKEFVDDGLEIINTSKNCYRLHTLDEISEYMSGSNKDYYLDLDNCATSIHNIDLLDIKMDCGKYLFDWINHEEDDNNVTRFFNDNFGINLSKLKIEKMADEKTLRIGNCSTPSEDIYVYFDKRNDYAKFVFHNMTYKFKTKSNSFYKLNNDFDISINELRGKERVVYWYYVKLTKPDNFNSVTTLRYWINEISDYRDVDYFSMIKVTNSTPNVEVDVNRFNLLRNEKVRITYSITYDSRPVNNLVKLDFDNKSYYSIDRQIGPDYFKYPESIVIGKPFNKTIEISYLNDGEYFLPEIIINGESYPFKTEKMKVETRFQRYANLVALILAIILFFIGDLATKYRDHSKMKDRPGLWKIFIKNPDRMNRKFDTLIHFYLLDILITLFILIVLMIIIIYFLIDIQLSILFAIGLILSALVITLAYYLYKLQSSETIVP